MAGIEEPPGSIDQRGGRSSSRHVFQLGQIGGLEFAERRAAASAILAEHGEEALHAGKHADVDEHVDDAVGPRLQRQRYLHSAGLEGLQKGGEQPAHHVVGRADGSVCAHGQSREADFVIAVEDHRRPADAA